MPGLCKFILFFRNFCVLFPWMPRDALRLSKLSACYCSVTDRFQPVTPCLCLAFISHLCQRFSGCDTERNRDPGFFAMFLLLFHPTQISHAGKLMQVEKCFIDGIDLKSGNQFGNSAPTRNLSLRTPY